MKTERSFAFVDYFKIVIKWRRIIVLNVAAMTLATAIISLLLPAQYTATTTILPPSDDTSTFSFMTVGISSGLAGLARMGAALPGLATPSDLFAAIMGSGRIRGAIIRKHNLKKIFKAKTMHDASKTLGEITKIEVSPEGLISVSITHRDKYLAADIANSYIDELDKFNTETAMTTGKKYRLFIEERLSNTEDTLSIAEEKLRTFQEEHHTIALNLEIGKAIETIAELKSQIILLEVKKGALVSSSQTGNPYLHGIDRELRELRKQLSKIEFGEKGGTTNEFGAGFSIPLSQLPEVSLEYARLLRDVKVQGAIYELLTQQYEQAKIMELKDTPTVQILDRAGPPERRSFPKRTKLVAIAFIVSLFLGLGLAFVHEYAEKIKRRKEGEELRNIVRILMNDFRLLKQKIMKIMHKKPKKTNADNTQV